MLAPLLMVIAALAEAPRQADVTGNALISKTDPPIRIQVDSSFKYAGGQQFILRDVAAADQHLFVQTDSKKVIERMYWIQLEQFLPGHKGQYQYDSDQPIEIGGLPMRSHVRSVKERPAPGSDRHRAYELLEKAGYALPPISVRARFIYLPTADRREEIMIIYLEAVGAARDLTTAESAALIRRATEGFAIGKAATAPSPDPPAGTRSK